MSPNSREKSIDICFRILVTITEEWWKKIHYLISAAFCVDRSLDNAGLASEIFFRKQP